MGMIDLGRGIYMMNGTSEAAREIARVTIVHLTLNAGVRPRLERPRPPTSSPPSAGLIPGLAINQSTDITCVDTIRRRPKKPGNGNDCTLGEDFIRVRVTPHFTPITPLVSVFGSHTFDSNSRMQIYP